MCIYCNNKTSKTFQVVNRGYGSIFDMMDLKIELCNNCVKEFKVQRKWFKEKPNEFGEYIYEKNIENLINIIINDNLKDETLTNICSSNII